jgi:hypothetical protein
VCNAGRHITQYSTLLESILAILSRNLKLFDPLIPLLESNPEELAHNSHKSL